jgi:hypothetical protein
MAKVGLVRVRITLREKRRNPCATFGGLKAKILGAGFLILDSILNQVPGFTVQGSMFDRDLDSKGTK